MKEIVQLLQGIQRDVRIVLSYDGKGDERIHACHLDAEKLELHAAVIPVEQGHGGNNSRFTEAIATKAYVLDSRGADEPLLRR